MSIVNSLLKKEFIEHKGAFLYVPGILISLLLFAFSTAVWRHGANVQTLADLDIMSDGGGLPGKIDIFNSMYAVSIVGWTGYLTLMLFFYYASSFSADRKNNALLFWKSMPVSDLNTMSIKTLAGLTIFPVVILLWSFIAAIVGFLAINIAALTTPIIGEINSGTSFWTFINVEISGMVFLVTTLLWYLPLFTFVGLLGTLLRSWAVPAFILILVMISALESIVTLGADGPITRLFEGRFNAPMTFVENSVGSIENGVGRNIADIVAVNEFVPGFLAQVDWLGMVLGWVVAGAFVYAASEYRRRRIVA